jgi:hypothetical protein
MIANPASAFRVLPLFVGYIEGLLPKNPLESHAIKKWLHNIMVSSHPS